MAKIEIKPGESVEICFEDTDGSVRVDFLVCNAILGTGAIRILTDDPEDNIVESVDNILYFSPIGPHEEDPRFEEWLKNNLPRPAR